VATRGAQVKQDAGLAEALKFFLERPIAGWVSVARRLGNPALFRLRERAAWKAAGIGVTLLGVLAGGLPQQEKLVDLPLGLARLLEFIGGELLFPQVS